LTIAQQGICETFKYAHHSNTLTGTASVLAGVNQSGEALSGGAIGGIVGGILGTLLLISVGALLYSLGRRNRSKIELSINPSVTPEAVENPDEVGVLVGNLPKDHPVDSEVGGRLRYPV